METTFGPSWQQVWRQMVECLGAESLISLDGSAPLMHRERTKTHPFTNHSPLPTAPTTHRNPTSPDMEQYSPLFDSGKTIDGKPMTGFPALGIWMSLKNKANFDAKLAEVEKFNAEHRWRKRGMRMTPVKARSGIPEATVPCESVR